MTNRRQPPSDPLMPTAAGLARGETAFHGGAPVREIGVVIDVDAERHAYRVRTPRGTYSGVGRILQSTSDAALLQAQTTVVLDHSLGHPYIDGVLPAAVPPVAERQATATGVDGHGGDDGALNRSLGGAFRGPETPRDLLPGDHALRSPDGAVAGAFHGKLAQLSGSPLAAVRAYGHQDAVEILAGLLRVVTWMGESRVLNEGGKTSFVWRGGSDQLTESGADEERYTLRLDLGHRGDVLNFAVTTPDGQPKFRLHVDPAGRVSVTSAGGVQSVAGVGEDSDVSDRVHGSRHVETSGDLTVRVGGGAVETVEGARSVTVSLADRTVVLGDRHARVARSSTENVEGNASYNVGGQYAATVLGAAKVTARQSYEVETPLAKLRGQLVELGTSANDYAVKYNVLRTILDAFIQHVDRGFAALADHVHPVGAGATAMSATLAVNPTFRTGFRSPQPTTALQAQTIKIGP